jgi:hypothetical protein
VTSRRSGSGTMCGRPSKRPPKSFEQAGSQGFRDCIGRGRTSRPLALRQASAERQRLWMSIAGSSSIRRLKRLPGRHRPARSLPSRSAGHGRERRAAARDRPAGPRSQAARVRRRRWRPTRSTPRSRPGSPTTKQKDTGPGTFRCPARLEIVTTPIRPFRRKETRPVGAAGDAGQPASRRRQGQPGSWRSSKARGPRRGCPCFG